METCHVKRTNDLEEVFFIGRMPDRMSCDIQTVQSSEALLILKRKKQGMRVRPSIVKA
jgi:hypothetical protein